MPLSLLPTNITGNTSITDYNELIDYYICVVASNKIKGVIKRKFLNFNKYIEEEIGIWT